MTDDTATGASNLTDWKLMAVLFAAGVLLYAHTLSFDLIYFDDDVTLLKNRHLLANLGQLGRIFLTDAFMDGSTYYYRPMFNVSFLFDNLIGGPPFFVSYLSNIVLHCVSAALLYRLLTAFNRPRGLSFVFSLFFLWHPSFARVVAWLPGRNESMLLTFILLAFLAFVKFLKKPDPLYIVGYFGFFLAALLAKETAIMLPLLSVFYAAKVFNGKVSRRAWLMLGAASLASIGVYALARSAAITGAAAVEMRATAGMHLSLSSLLPLLGQTLLPINPSVWPTGSRLDIVLGIAAAVILAAAGLRLANAQKSVIGFGLLWYILFIAPTFLVGNNYGLLYYSQRLYLPLAGFLIAFSELNWIKNLNFTGLVTKTATAAILIYFGAISFTHSYNYSNRLFFWERAVEEQPLDANAQFSLANVYQSNQLDASAERHYKLALAINPKEYFAHQNLANIYARRGQRLLSEAELKSELEINPGFAALRAKLPSPQKKLPRKN